MQKNKKKRKHALSFEEYRQIKENKKKRQTVGMGQKKRNKINNLKKLENAKLILYDNDRNAEMLLNQRLLKSKLKILDFFFEIVNESILENLIKENIKLNQTYLPRKILSKNPNNLILRYFATRLNIIGNAEEFSRDNWFKKKDKLKGYLGYNNFIKMLNHFSISFQFISHLNNCFSQHLIAGRVITIDEKLVPFEGESPHKSYCPGKNPSNGHWFSEITTKLEKSGLPYLLWLKFKQKQKSFKMIDIFNDAINLAKQKKKPSIIVADAYYLDDISRLKMLDNKIPYICAVNPRRFSELWTECKKYVKHNNDWIILRINDTNEVCMQNWDEKLGIKNVLTNAFSIVHTQNKYKDNVIWDAYQFYFNTCDRLNAYLNRYKWPYKRIGWKSNIDDFLFSVMIHNIYALYHEFCTPQTQLTKQKFCLKLSSQLFNFIDNK